MKLYSPSTIADIRERYNFQLSRSLGQNFITDRSIIERIVEGAGVGENDLVIEIGPGIGVLTAEAAEAAARVIAVEIDSKLIPILSETLAEYDNIKVINQDILKTDVNKIIEEEKAAGNFTGAVRIIGNLPYYITTPIIMGLLESGVKADSITVMMQKEVADRIKASPGSKTYGAISAAVQYYCIVEQIASVPKEVFVPRPKVDSAVLNLHIRKEKPVELTDEKMFFACIRSGFGQRRKTLLNSLTGTAGLSKEDIRNILSTAGIDPVRRAETLNMEEFAAIANEAAACSRRQRNE
ncbi:MAG: 16S rRNA (adenine(1518)-N(6)/adenine(1519)-N(6))-dimethyltransferase RsmA [Lentihominibacter sp.]|nr:16S rRNA (adenine(1518)-N(6)/adenine(1519)-N(6))-dimethyltransferase RsmA [Clostridiales bacterium]MDY2680384.1 16S rRNA (adenine(1518)-N(6)/adenine(1519)-N(6))-dimethyltransferase RsmA [Lentihominibacter sp.]